MDEPTVVNLGPSTFWAKIGFADRFWIPKGERLVRQPLGLEVKLFGGPEADEPTMYQHVLTKAKHRVQQTAPATLEHAAQLIADVFLGDTPNGLIDQVHVGLRKPWAYGMIPALRPVRAVRFLLDRRKDSNPVDYGQARDSLWLEHLVLQGHYNAKAYLDVVLDLKEPSAACQSDSREDVIDHRDVYRALTDRYWNRQFGQDGLDNIEEDARAFLEQRFPSAHAAYVELMGTKIPDAATLRQRLGPTVHTRARSD